MTHHLTSTPTTVFDLTNFHYHPVQANNRQHGAITTYREISRLSCCDWWTAATGSAGRRTTPRPAWRYCSCRAAAPTGPSDRPRPGRASSRPAARCRRARAPAARAGRRGRAGAASAGRSRWRWRAGGAAGRAVGRPRGGPAAGCRRCGAARGRAGRGSAGDSARGGSASLSGGSGASRALRSIVRTTSVMLGFRTFYWGLLWVIGRWEKLNMYHFLNLYFFKYQWGVNDWHYSEHAVKQRTVTEPIDEKDSLVCSVKTYLLFWWKCNNSSVETRELTGKPTEDNTVQSISRFGLSLFAPTRQDFKMSSNLLFYEGAFFIK